MIKRHIFLLLWSICWGSSSLSAQLSGDYTLGGATGARNFSSWVDFVSEWNKNGVSGNVRLQVLKNDTLKKSLVLKQHSSAPTKANRRITVLGNGFKILGNFNKEVLHLQGMDHLILKKLNIENTATSSSLLGIRFSNRADSNQVDSCTIVFSQLARKGSDTGAYIAFAADTGRISRNITQHPGIGNSITHGRFYSVLSQSPGPFYGIYDKQGSQDYTRIPTHNRIDSNTISTFYSVGILMQFINGERCRGNVITRENCSATSATDTTLIGIFCLDGRSDSQAIAITHNRIEHLPYKNADIKDASNFIWNLYGINAWKISGGGKKVVLIDNNVFSDFVYYSRFHGILSQYGEQISISYNYFYDIEGDRGYSFGIYSQLGDDVKIEFNRLRKIDFGSRNSGDGVLIFGNEMGSGTWGENRISGNILDSNGANKELYAVAAMWKGNWDISENKITHNYTVATKGQTVGIYFYYCVNMYVHDNLLAYNYGPAETYYIYSTNYNTSQNLFVFHNTLYDSVASNSGHATAMVYLDDDSQTEIMGNIVQGDGSGDVFPMFLNTVASLGPVKDNSIYLTGYSTENWAFEVNQYTSFTDWNRYGPKDSMTYWFPASFANKSAGDFRSREYRNQNNVKSYIITQRDVNGKLRNLVAADRGAVCDSLNLRIFLGLAIPDTVCSGFILAQNIQVINDYVDTVIDVSISVNHNGVVSTQKRRMNLLPKDTGSFIMAKAIQLDQWGWNEVSIYIGSSNDNNGDDTLNYRVFVKPSPGGAQIIPYIDSNQSNIPIIGSAFDVVLCHTKIGYSFSPPRGFTRNQFGNNNKWAASIQAFTLGGSPIKGAQLDSSRSGSDVGVRFVTSDTSLEDSFVILKLRIIDLSTGCDTLIQRRIYIEPTPIVTFETDSTLCNHDTLYVKNTSSIRAGNSYMRYFWEFGNADTSSDFNPIVVFRDTGWQPIKLTITTSPYNFTFYYLDSVRVKPIPDVSFSKGNACEGRNVVFKNESLSKAARFTWDFGDGSAVLKSDSAQVFHNYSKRGNYNVVLSALAEGCENFQSTRLSVFEQPIALLGVDTVVCMGERLDFNTKTQMQTAIFGVRWDFDEEGAFSTQKNTEYTYQTAGDKRVRYVVKSEFGCIDSTQINVRVKESPEAQFDYDQLCLLSPTRFTNTTKAVSGALWQLQWQLNDVNQGSQSAFNTTWEDTGKQKIMLKVSLDNGCVDSTVRMVKILNEVDVDFDFEVLCAGDSVRFENKSIPLEGVNFTWSWGGGESRESVNTRLVFDAVDSTSVPVLLRASALNSCVTEVIKNVPVLPRPRTCDFDYASDYDYAFYGFALNPKDDEGKLGGQPGVAYTWDIENTGVFYTEGESAELKSAFFADGSYAVKMRARTGAHGCMCEKEYTVVMDRLDRSEPDFQISVFPNPVSGDQIQIQGPQEMTAVRLVGVNGQTWSLRVVSQGIQSYLIILPHISNGIYQLEWLTAGKWERVKLVVAGR